MSEYDTSVARRIYESNPEDKLWWLPSSSQIHAILLQDFGPNWFSRATLNHKTLDIKVACEALYHQMKNSTK